MNNDTTATAVQSEKKNGLTKEEILLCVDLAIKFVLNDDGTPKEGILPAGLLTEISVNKLGRMLELTPENKRLWWACHLAGRAHKGGMSYADIGRAMDYIQNRYSALTVKRAELMAEIKRLDLDPERVRGLTVAEIDDKLSKLKESRKARSLTELAEILRFVNTLERELGFKEEELTLIDLNPERFTSKSVVETDKQELLRIKNELQTTANKQALEASRALKARIIGGTKAA
ncbi:hypothetical protein IT407_01090 [Candidatus Uhrbacteria bacterium]|nr:hypothetical protein [Candidatus Uhrbacteria bacterium]